MTNARQDTLYRKIDREKMPVPATGIFDSPYYIKRINTDWYKHISGIVSGLYEMSAWQGTDEEIKRAIDEVHAWLSEEISMIENCNDVQNCLSDDSPIMQSIYESNHRSANAQAITIANQRVQAYYDNAQNMYKYNQYLGNSWLMSSSENDKAVLCGAVYYWLQSIRENINAYGTQVIQGIFGAQTYLTLSSIPALALAGIGAVPSAVIGIGLGVASIVVTDWIDAFSNQSAFDEVACIMQNAIANRELSKAGYLSALDATESSVTLPDSEKIMNHIQTYYGNSIVNTFNLDNAYLWFADIVASANSNYTPPIGSECNCIELPECTIGVNQYYPSASGFTLPDSAIELGDNAIYTQNSTGVKCIRISPSGGYFTIKIPRMCVQSITFTCQSRSLSGGASGGVKLTLTTDADTIGEIETYGGTTATSRTLNVDSSIALFKPVTYLRVSWENDESANGYGYSQDFWSIRLWVKI